jgi:hypothetical protein
MTSPRLQLDDGVRLEGVRVLVLDDAHYVREVVADILTRDGATVAAVGSADEAWLMQFGNERRGSWRGAGGL